MSENEPEQEPINIKEILKNFTDEQLRKDCAVFNTACNEILAAGTKDSITISMFAHYLYKGLPENGVANHAITSSGGEFLANAVMRSAYESELLRRETE